MPALMGTLFLLKPYPLSWTHALLVGASLLFYAFLDWQHLPILLISAIINYTLSLRLTCKGKTKAYLIIGIIFNLTLLAGYKYLSFFASLAHLSFPQTTAPLGISFFTFHQLAYLIDIYTRRTHATNVRDYALYVTFFPHLIAGPIMRYTQFAPQLSVRPKHIPYTAGIFFFSVGLFKKVALADTFAPISDRMFDAPSLTLSFLEAWKGLLAYTWQIYFDFSGYADMAIGLGLLCGIALPVNFLAPYQANSISDFWRRWHISLSQFLRDYLYIPLGGNRFGYARQMLALLLTMSLAGLWHGASWNFVLWGTFHGLLLSLAHSWKLTLGKTFSLPSIVGIGITFTCVTLLWVLFRAQTLQDALILYKTLLHVKTIDSTMFSIEWLYIFTGGLIVFTCKPLALWTHYDAKHPSLEHIKVTFYDGALAGFLLLVALKMLSTEVSRSFVYFVF
jgi:alginate O-acetyltransferase complex protein AlgI